MFQEPMFKVIKPKKKLPVVDIWNEMTVSELADSTKRDIDNIIEAVSLADTSKRYNENTVIKDKKILQAAVRLLGVKFKIISKPDDKKDEDIKDHDVTKRYQ